MRTKADTLALVAGAVGAAAFLTVVAIADGMPDGEVPRVRAAAANLPEFALLGGDAAVTQTALAASGVEDPVAPSSIEGALVTLPNLSLRALSECAPYQRSLAAMQRATDGLDPNTVVHATDHLLATQTWCGPSHAALRTTREAAAVALRDNEPAARVDPPSPSNPPGGTPGGPGGPGYPTEEV